jgi:hypothetical protein
MSATFQPDRMPGYALPKYEYRTPPALAPVMARIEQREGNLDGISAL